MKEVDVIGRAERADFPDLSAKRVPVKIDTGADYCSMWASCSKDGKGNLKVIFFGPSSRYYTGEPFIFTPDEYEVTRVANSFGDREVRYKIKLRIKVKGRLINALFTLSDRSAKLYPVLIGRSLLKGKFLVDVSKGRPLLLAERKRAHELEAELQTLKKEKKL